MQSLPQSQSSGKGECRFSLKHSAALTKLAYILMQSKIHKQNLHETQQSYKCQFEVNNGAIDGAYRKATCQLKNHGPNHHTALGHARHT